MHENRNIPPRSRINRKLHVNNNEKSICVIGLGYIGLPTASLLGTKGYRVHGVDVSPEVVETINQGRIHIVEPDLDILVKSAVGSGNLRAGLEPRAAVPTTRGTDRPRYVRRTTGSCRTRMCPGRTALAWPPVEPKERRLRSQGATPCVS